jgi:hypothetical protein
VKSSNYGALYQKEAVTGGREKLHEKELYNLQNRK